MAYLVINGSSVERESAPLEFPTAISLCIYVVYAVMVTMGEKAVLGTSIAVVVPIARFHQGSCSMVKVKDLPQEVRSFIRFTGLKDDDEAGNFCFIPLDSNDLNNTY